MSKTVSAAEIKELIDSSWVVDTHCDTAMHMLDGDRDIGKRLKEGHIDIPRMRKGGVDVQFFALWVEPKYCDENRGPDRVLQMWDALDLQIRKHSRHLMWARDLKEIRQAKREGKIACVAAVEGGHAIDDDLRILRAFHALGVRYMTLTWMNNNNWADGSGDAPVNNGLTDFGEMVIKEMNRLDMIVDVSHVSEDTFWDVMKVTKKPVMASHSNARALADHHRNLTDAQLEEIAKNDGIVCVNYYPGFLVREQGQPDETKIQNYAAILRRAKKAKPPSCEMDVVIDHICHIAEVAGDNRVGLGSDFDGINVTANGLEDISTMPALARRMRERGLSKRFIRGVLGANVVRFLERTWS